MIVGAGFSTNPAHDGANRHPWCESTGCFRPALVAQDECCQHPLDHRLVHSLHPTGGRWGGH